MLNNCYKKDLLFLSSCFSPGKVTVGWLAEEAVRRYVKVHPSSGGLLLPSSTNNNKLRVIEVRKTGGNILLDAEDEVADVLDDNDFVNIRMENDLPDTSATMGPAVHNYDHSMSEPFISPTKLDAIANQITDNEIVLDGYHLTVKDLVLLSKGQTTIRLRKVAEERVAAGRQLVDAILKDNKVVTGILFLFHKCYHNRILISFSSFEWLAGCLRNHDRFWQGKQCHTLHFLLIMFISILIQFARMVISADKLEELQENLIRSHSAGVGQPLSLERVRMLMALRINTLAKGYSGVSLKTLNQVINAFNRSCLPWVPEQGTVGASGDLAPLSHLALGMIGEGKVLTDPVLKMLMSFSSDCLAIIPAVLFSTPLLPT